MAKQNSAPASVGVHGATRLPSVDIDSYNVEVRDDEGFVGDRANKAAFQDLLEKWRKPLRKLGADPFGDEPSEDVSKKTLEKILAEGEPQAAGVVQSAIEEFAQELATVVRRFLKLKSWQDTEHIIVGGGFRLSRVGELAIGRADVILKDEGVKLDLQPIRFHPDEAGLIGAVHLVPSWILEGHDGILAVDIGGTNFRAGVVRLNRKKNPNLGKSEVWKSDCWRHADDKPTREQAVKRLLRMLKELMEKAEKSKLKLAPFIGIGCPGVIEEKGAIERGGQNLPGNWESSKFNLPALLAEGIPSIGEHDTAILMHNDAVVQGLSERPFMDEFKHWGVLTIGTGLGNARFTNRENGSD
jgi:predicted NBD/HSP70 family sugar kinase